MRAQAFVLVLLLVAGTRIYAAEPCDVSGIVARTAAGQTEADVWRDCTSVVTDAEGCRPEEVAHLVLENLDLTKIRRYCALQKEARKLPADSTPAAPHARFCATDQGSCSLEQAALIHQECRCTLGGGVRGIAR